MKKLLYLIPLMLVGCTPNLVDYNCKVTEIRLHSANSAYYTLREIDSQNRYTMTGFKLILPNDFAQVNDVLRFTNNTFVVVK